MCSLKSEEDFYRRIMRKTFPENWIVSLSCVCMYICLASEAIDKIDIRQSIMQMWHEIVNLSLSLYLSLLYYLLYINYKSEIHSILLLPRKDLMKEAENIDTKII